MPWRRRTTVFEDKGLASARGNAYTDIGIYPREGIFHKSAMQTLMTYVTEALEELRHVRWPTRQQAVRLSAIVLGFCAVATAAFGVVDFALSQVVKLLLTLTY